MFDLHEILLPLADDINEVSGSVQLNNNIPLLDELSIEVDDLIEVYFDFRIIFIQAVPWALFIVSHWEDELVLGETNDLVNHVLRAEFPRVCVYFLVESDQFNVFLP